MFVRGFRFSLLFLLIVSGAAVAFGQGIGADGRPMTGSSNNNKDNDERPKSFRETLEKLRIEKEKKDYDQMIERGEEAVKISENLERAYEQNGRLTDREIAQLAEAEKLVKKIRSELGGDGDDEDKPTEGEQPPSQKEAVKSFRTTVAKLFGELKKTSRFTISAAAIQTSNAAIKIARFLKLSN